MVIVGCGVLLIDVVKDVVVKVVVGFEELVVSGSGIVFVVFLRFLLFEM